MDTTLDLARSKRRRAADGEFVVLTGSQALKERGYARNSYARLKEDLIRRGVLVAATDGQTCTFTRSYAFKAHQLPALLFWIEIPTGGRDGVYLVPSSPITSGKSEKRNALGCGMSDLADRHSLLAQRNSIEQLKG